MIVARRRNAGETGWEFHIPVATNVFLWYDLARAYVAAYLVSVILMAVVFILAGEPGSVVAIARIFAIVFLGLTVLSVPIAFIWYANRISVRFTLSLEGLLYETLERKDKVLNRALIVLGLVFGRPGAAGTGLLARTREREFTRWRDVQSVVLHPSWSVITLKGRWRVIQRIYCPPERYAAIARRVGGYVARARSTRPPY